MNEEKKIDILSLTLPQLEEKILELSEPRFRAKQIYGWINKGMWGSEMRNIPASLQKKLEDVFEFRLPTISKKLVSSIDGTVKYLFKLIDGEYIESVFMRYEHGNTLCISSQVGCRMGCKFCASTLLGRVRNLEPSEMLGQIISAEKDTGERISNVVMMGIGEPLDNYDNTISFLRLVGSKDGLNIGLRHISLSTCGLVDKINQLSSEGLSVTLSVSLHAYDNSVRSSIMPINNKYPIEQLLTACDKYFQKTGRRISFEYTLISGKNDTVEGAIALASILKKYIHGTCHVNLIPLNEVKETRLETSRNINIFKNKLISLGINATVRRRLGSDINASCGQLRRQAKEENQ
ncbi:MAG: 23S rRNA (adenine(2503)-C(2))-methyltransferase RlmN [Clostridia bacterium]|nr:23S rRNA (adenine(2503)-C(2))-methyltransferase RlmN [Clostridia bacterium]